MKELLESVQGNLPVAQARWLRSKAELRGGSLSSELRCCVHLAMQVENLVGATDIHYVTAPAGEAAFSAKSRLARYVDEVNKLSGNRPAVAAFLDPPSDDPSSDHPNGQCSTNECCRVSEMRIYMSIGHGNGSNVSLSFVPGCADESSRLMAAASARR